MIHILLVTVLVGMNEQLSAQIAGKQVDSLFGLDPLLYNGKYYYYLPPYGTEGTPFLFPAHDTQASVMIRGVIYRGLTLNYDILNQQVILQYTRQDQGVAQISLSEAWLEEFELFGRKFRLVNTEDTLRKIAEVTGKGRLCIYTLWSRDLVLKSSAGYTRWAFSKEKARMFLVTVAERCSFHNRRTFLKCLPEESRKSLRSLMQKEGIRFRTADKADWEKLLLYTEGRGTQ